MNATQHTAHWRYQPSVQLRSSVESYLSWASDVGPRPSDDQLDLLLQYLRSYAFDPRFDRGLTPVHTAYHELGRLRKQIADPILLEQIRDWLQLALNLGIDPL